MKLKPGTILLTVPTSGTPESKCLVCTGPEGRPGREKHMARDAFVVGMVAGILALQKPRLRLCIAHEKAFREALCIQGVQLDEELLMKLDIEYALATGEEDVEPVRVGPARSRSSS